VGERPTGSRGEADPGWTFRDAGWQPLARRGSGARQDETPGWSGPGVS